MKSKKLARFTYSEKEGLFDEMYVLELSEDGGKTWDFSHGYVINHVMGYPSLTADAITGMQRAVALGYTFVEGGKHHAV